MLMIERFIEFLTLRIIITVIMKIIEVLTEYEKNDCSFMSIIKKT